MHRSSRPRARPGGRCRALRLLHLLPHPLRALELVHVHELQPLAVRFDHIHEIPPARVALAWSVRKRDRDRAVAVGVGPWGRRPETAVGSQVCSGCLALAGGRDGAGLPGARSLCTVALAWSAASSIRSRRSISSLACWSWRLVRAMASPTIANSRSMTAVRRSARCRLQEPARGPGHRQPPGCPLGVASRWLRQPRPGAYSQGFGACKDDGERPGDVAVGPCDCAR
jgi:hypothetical protein